MKKETSMRALSQTAGCLILSITLAVGAHAGTILSEGFDDVPDLPASGWVTVNRSNPIGTTSWFQGDAGVFPASTGNPDSYAAANFLNTSFAGGNISDWLLTPVLSF